MPHTPPRHAHRRPSPTKLALHPVRVLRRLLAVAANRWISAEILMEELGIDTERLRRGRKRSL